MWGHCCETTLEFVVTRRVRWRVRLLIMRAFFMRRIFAVGPASPMDADSFNSFIVTLSERNLRVSSPRDSVGYSCSTLGKMLRSLRRRARIFGPLSLGSQVPQTWRLKDGRISSDPTVPIGIGLQFSFDAGTNQTMCLRHMIRQTTCHTPDVDIKCSLQSSVVHVR